MRLNQKVINELMVHPGTQAALDRRSTSEIGADWLGPIGRASPKDIAGRVGRTSVVTVLDRYGHLLPQSGDKVNDALIAMAGAAAESAAPGRVLDVLELRRHQDGTASRGA